MSVPVHLKFQKVKKHPCNYIERVLIDISVSMRMLAMAASLFSTGEIVTLKINFYS